MGRMSSSVWLHSEDDGHCSPCISCDLGLRLDCKSQLCASCRLAVVRSGSWQLYREQSLMFEYIYLRHRSHGYVFVDPLTFRREKRLKEAKEPSAGPCLYPSGRGSQRMA